jgi:hypothetical protein
MSAHDTQPNLRSAFPDGAGEDPDADTMRIPSQPPRDEILRRLELDACDLRLTVEEYFIQDDATVPDYPGPHLLAVVYAGRATALTPGGREVRPIHDDAVRQLHALATAACHDKYRPGIDTAIGRTYTSLELQFRHARGSAQSFVARIAVNHAAPGPLPPAWSALLGALREPFGASRGAFADAWDRALTWSAPIALGPHWDAGHVVRLPHVVTAFESESPVYIRTGQPSPHSGPFRDLPSVLYRFDGTTLTCIDDRTTIAPLFDARTRWRLPCGGGTLAVHTDWDHPRRIVIRTDDARGVYVQRDS